MPDLSLWLLAAIGLTFIGAGLVKGITGMGLPTVAMGVLGALLTPVTAAALLLVPSFVTNVWQLLAGPAFGALLRRLWPMMIGIAGGTLAASSWLVGGDTDLTAAALGATLILYAGVTLLVRPLAVPRHWEAWLAPWIGLATGLVTGSTGVFVIPAVPYLQALGLERDELVQALGLSFTVSTIALAAALIWQGAFATGQLGLSALAVIPALIGMAAGQALRHRISPAIFRRWFLIALLLLGAELLSRPFL